MLRLARNELIRLRLAKSDAFKVCTQPTQSAASKIPPIYERQTASNISFEEGGVFNVSKPCNRQLPLSSVSRGVTLWPQEEEVASSKGDTVPLLSPTMESELLKEPWVFPQSKINMTKDEERIASCAWEENFQDLSGWCMDTFQGQCDFHIGESTFNVSGTKYEGNSVLSSGEGVLKDLTSVTDEEKWSIKMNTVGTTEHLSDNRHSLQSTSKPTSKYEKEDSSTESNTSITSWLKLPRGAAVAASNITSWNKQNNADVSTSFQSRYHVDDLDLDDACPPSFDSAESQRETLDVLCTVETTGSDTFDLLSYLCDDEMHSPEGSVSTDSSTVSKLGSKTKTFITIPQTPVKVKAEKKGKATRHNIERRASSTITSRSTETPIVPSRRSERTRISTSSKVEKTYNKVKREKQERKHYADADEDDRTFVLHYRESREKNNEASRKSRMNKKAKESEMAMRAIELERDNRVLKMKVEELEKLVTSMRSALLRSALRKEI